MKKTKYLKDNKIVRRAIINLQLTRQAVALVKIDW